MELLNCGATVAVVHGLALALGVAHPFVHPREADLFATYLGNLVLVVCDHGRERAEVTVLVAQEETGFRVRVRDADGPGSLAWGISVVVACA